MKNIFSSESLANNIDTFTNVASINIDDITKRTDANELVFLDRLRYQDYCLKCVTLSLYDPNETYEKLLDYIDKWTESSKSSDGQPSDDQLQQDIDKNIFYNSKPIYRIVLPLMNALQEQNQHDYSDETGLFNGARSIVNAASTSVSKALATISSENADSAKFVPQAPIMNPLKWQSYNGSKLRQFSFVFRLSPRNTTEASNMLKIIYILKKYSFPKKATGTVGQVLLPPARIRVEFSNPILQKLINPGICVITDINVVYESGNDVAVTLDGVPKKTEITITLSEYRQKFSDDYDDIQIL